VVDAHVDPARVLGEVVDAVGDRLAELFVFEVVHADRDRRALRAQLAPAVFEVADQRLLFGVDADHRLALIDRRLDGGVDVLKLRVAVWMLAALADLGVGLQAVAQPAQQPRDRLVRDAMAERAQRVGELAHALGRPAQRLLGIAAAIRVDQSLQIADQRRVGLGQRPAAPAATPDPARLKRVTALKLRQPGADRVLRDPRRARNRRDPATAVRARLRRRLQTTATLVKLARQRPIALPDRVLVDHPSGSYDPQTAIPPSCSVTSPKRIRAVELVGEIPRSASGKILRRLLRDGAAG